MNTRKLYRLATKYRLTGGLMFIGLLGLIAWGITALPKASPVLPQASATPLPQRFDSEISIKEASLSGKLLGVREQALFALNPTTLQQEVLATGLAFRSPQRLIDGRLAAFYQTSETGKTGWRVLLQKQDRFEVIPLPVLAAQTEPYLSTVPLLDPNGQFAVFLDVRAQTGQSVARPVVVRYALTDLTEEILTKPAVLAATQVFLSPDGQWIGFGYQKVTNGTLEKTRSVGLIPGMTKTVNLFPLIELADDRVAFSSNNDYLFFHAKTGLGAFRFEEGKVVETLSKKHLGAILADGSLGVMSAAESVASLLKSCANATSAQGTEQVEWYQLGNKGFKKVGVAKKKDTVFSPSKSITNQGEQWLTGVYTSSNCEGEWGLWDLKTERFSSLGLPLSLELQWVP